MILQSFLLELVYTLFDPHPLIDPHGEARTGFIPILQVKGLKLKEVCGLPGDGLIWWVLGLCGSLRPIFLAQLEKTLQFCFWVTTDWRIWIGAFLVAESLSVLAHIHFYFTSCFYFIYSYLNLTFWKWEGFQSGKTKVTCVYQIMAAFVAFGKFLWTYPRTFLFDLHAIFFPVHKKINPALAPYLYSYD